jgi:insulysin
MRCLVVFTLLVHFFIPISASSVQTEDLVQAPYELIEDRASIPLLNPSMQKRQIVKLRLKNGLETYLISDPESKHSAAAVAVKSGSWDDPRSYPGMAHFVEHLLFMGSGAYPEEADFSKYVSTHAGTYNACTMTDRTVYMFSINHEGFPGALDRLAHFFIDPQLSLSCIERELQAVDQEHAKNIEHDGWRQWMILKETGNPDHPHAGFSTGNAETLGGIPQEQVQSWFHEHYTADNMRLVVVSPLPKEQLIQLAVNDFSPIPTAPKTELKASPRSSMLSAAQRGHMLYIKPVRNLRELALLWELPHGLDRQQKHDALSLLTYMLGSEHEGGLVSQLKKQQIAQNLRAGFLHFGDEETIFSIEVELTDQGLQNPDHVIQQIFAALNLIRESSASTSFAELHQLSLLHYQYLARKNAFQFVEEYGRTIFDESLATFPENNAIPQTFDQVQFSKLLNFFSAESCAFILTADPELTKVPPQQREKWMGAEYAFRSIPAGKLTSWQNTLPSSTLCLAPPNTFIPAQLTLLPSSSGDAKEPEVLWEKDSGRLFYMRDTFYQVPETATNFRIYSPLLDGSPRASVLSQLYCMSFDEKLSPTLSMAEAAGLQATLSPSEHYLALSLGGYSEKLSSLAVQLFSQLPKIAPSREQYAIYRKRLEIALANASKDMPIAQAKEIVSNVLLSSFPTHQQKLEAISELTYEDFLEFASHLFSKVYFEGLVYGNCSEQDARYLTSALEESLQAKPYPSSSILQRKVRVLPENAGPFLIVESTDTLGKATMLVIQQGPRYFITHAAQLVANAVLHEMFFDSLRTKQQTAYLARAQGREIEGQLLQLFMVQSSTHQPQELLARFELFLEEFLQRFDENVQQERFETLRNMLIQEYSLPPENLHIMAQRLTDLAIDRDTDFQFYPKLVASLNELDRLHVKSFLEKTLSRKNTRRLAVLIEGKLPATHDFSYKRLAKEDIKMIGDFESKARQ